ncbi:MAG TPA: N-acetylglucosamine-6-phosphate deacetylase [Lachnospiraceae bacterium]|nr:N-acetylglucosamine-6-phosphate deacetylase [Lachnospiraceae bacterium]
MVIRGAYVYGEDGKFIKKDIFLKEQRIVDTSENDSDIVDAEGLYAIPGLTDIHFHGCVGYDFCDGSKEALQVIANYQARNGVTTICPASMTLKEEELAHIFATLAGYRNEEGADYCGINMEGPFVSVKKKGAQNERYIVEPDIDMFHRLQRISGNLIKLVDIAPENPGAIEFIKNLKDEVVISLAHTEANYEEAMEAFLEGASHVTHLYNAMMPFTHRAPGLIGAAFDNPRCNVELICDGIHIHPSAIRATYQMFGADRVILVSDSMRAAGMPDGEYTLGGQVVKVEGKLATLQSDGAIAGSVTNLMDCMRYAVTTAGISLENAVRSAAVNSAKAIGIYDRYGSISVGKFANIVLLDKELNIKSVYLKGKEIYE